MCNITPLLSSAGALEAVDDVKPVEPETELLPMDIAVAVEDFLGGMTGLLGGTGGGTPRAIAADFFGVVGWAEIAVPVVPTDVDVGNVALVVT